MSYPLVRLQKNQERRLLAGQSWIYSNEIDNSATPLKSFTKGSLVRVEAQSGRPLGIGYINPNTLLAVRLLTRDSQAIIDVSFLKARIQSALTLRTRLFSEPYYRLIHGESDGLPGLIIDRFGDVLVGQLNTAGMQALESDLIQALLEIVQPQHILWRNDAHSRTLEGLPEEIRVAHGQPPHVVSVWENGCTFKTNIFEGQKTGWFYDHRYSRQYLMPYVAQKTVLDVFAYLGAFALPLAKAGATAVTAIDISEKATTQLLENAALNQLSNVHTLTEDAFDALEKLHADGQRFDVVVLDPPAFIKRQKDLEAGIIAYLRANQLAMSLLNPQGILFSASCSMHLTRDELLNTIRRAGLKMGKTIRILEQTHQAPDHPIHPSIPETEYLKGFIISVE